ncbi:flagellin [Massilia cavernae]|uniref:flagellin n=1 Tax=Massilia cavernae TaxID=2320864 RepID=UPI00269FDDBD|nr:flagellin [Massilia cavernae]
MVQDSSTRPWNDPLEGFTEIFPTTTASTGMRDIQVQVGANASDTIKLSLAAMNASALGRDDLNLKRSAIAIAHIDEAIAFVTQQRVVVGSSSKRLEVAASAGGTNTEALQASRSRIVDTDYAAETVALTRSQIL